MCFDSTSSLIAWGISWTIALYLWKRNRGVDRWNSAFIFTFSTIQILEAGIWWGPSPAINGVLTELVLLVLLAQPLIQSWMGYNYTGEKVLGLLFALCLLVWLLSWSRLDHQRFSSSPGEKGHLVWSERGETNFLGCPLIVLLYFAGLFIPLLYHPSGTTLIAVGIVTALYSLLRAGPKEFGSYWCFTAVAYSILCL